METSFEKSVDILAKAYLNDTLKHLQCSKCAVGNLLQGYGVKNPANWMSVICKNRNFKFLVYPDTLEAGYEELSVLNYTIDQIDKIEKIFESHCSEDNFKALMAIVDYLAEIHNVDLSIKEEAKKMFVKT